MRIRFISFGAWLVVSGTLLSAILFSSYEGWAYCFSLIVIAVGGVCWSFPQFAGSTVESFNSRSLLWLLPLCWMLIYTLPLPYELLKAVAPVAADGYHRAYEVLGTTGSYSLSVARGETMRMLMLYAGAFLICFVMHHHWAVDDSRDTLHHVLIWFGGLLALISILHRLSGSNDLLMFYTPPDGGDAMGPFTNRNHYAAFMNLFFFISAGWLLRMLDHHRKRHKHRLWLYVFLLTVMISSVLISGSRAGILVTMIGMVILLFTSRHIWLRHVQPRMIILGGVVLILFAAWIGLGETMRRVKRLDRIAGDPFGYSRTVAYKDTLHIIRDMPWTGSGAGTFKHMFSGYQSEAIKPGRWHHAHSDILEYVAENGLVGFILLLPGVFGVCLRRKGTAPRDAALFCGYSVALIVFLLHACVDYQLYRASNLFMFAATLGLFIPATADRRRTSKWTLPVIGGLSGAVLLAAYIHVGPELAYKRFEVHARQVPLRAEAAEKSFFVRQASNEIKSMRPLTVYNPEKMIDAVTVTLSWFTVPDVDPVTLVDLVKTEVELVEACALSSYPNMEYWNLLRYLKQMNGKVDTAMRIDQYLKQRNGSE